VVTEFLGWPRKFLSETFFLTALKFIIKSPNRYKHLPFAAVGAVVAGVACCGCSG